MIDITDVLEAAFNLEFLVDKGQYGSDVYYHIALDEDHSLVIDCAHSIINYIMASIVLSPVINCDVAIQVLKSFKVIRDLDVVNDNVI